MLELMIVVAIAGVLAAIAAPGMMDFIRSQSPEHDRAPARCRSAPRAARGDQAQHARAGLPGRHASPESADPGPTAWAQGWLVCYDADASGDCDDTAATNPNPIRRHGAIEPSLTLTGPAGVARFNANGTQGASGAGALTFTTKGTWTGSKSYVETVSATGNVSMTAGS